MTNNQKMKKIISFLTLMLLSLSLLFGQTNMGTLKIFSEEPILVYVDEVHQPDYSAITLIAGTHYVKAINKDEVKIYSEIVTVLADQVTSILIETPVTKTREKTETSVYNPNPASEIIPIKIEESTPPVDLRTAINIGQVDGKLRADKSGAFGLTFGMDESATKLILNPQSYQVIEKGEGFISYGMADTRGSVPIPFLTEARFINGKLFDILVAYVPVDIEPAKQELYVNKNRLPLREYDEIKALLLSQYGEPASSERTFKGGYTDGDGREFEAIKAKQALIRSVWTDPDTGNEVVLTLSFSTTAGAAAALISYSDGALSKEAAKRNLVINSYNYGKTFLENYNSK
jgi:hypothetical protein